MLLQTVAFILIITIIIVLYMYYVEAFVMVSFFNHLSKYTVHILPLKQLLKHKLMGIITVLWTKSCSIFRLSMSQTSNQEKNNTQTVCGFHVLPLIRILCVMNIFLKQNGNAKLNEKTSHKCMFMKWQAKR